MIVLVDAGNTRVKLGWVLPGGRRETSPLALRHTDLHHMADWLRELPARPVSAVGVNVAGGAVARTITEQLAAMGCNMDWISSSHSSPGIVNAYDPPQQLGADRWVSLIGLARHAHKPGTAAGQASAGRSPLILASFGTATTVDTLMPDLSIALPSLDTQGWIFQGGTIFPGPTLMRSSLVTGTAGLPEAHGEVTAYPRNTHQAIVTGVAAAQAGALLRQWLAGLDHYGRAPHVYSSGGGWPLVQDEVQALLAAAQSRMQLPQLPVQWLPTPVLDGLAGLVEASV